ASPCRRSRARRGAGRAWVRGLPASRAIRVSRRRERRGPPASRPPSPERDGGGSVAAMGVLEGLRDVCPALALHTDGPALAAGGLDALRPSRGRPELAVLAPRPLAQVDAALAPHGLMLGHDPWTVGVATVGGALATNGLGYLGARAGSFGAQVRALEAVLADGTIVRTRSSPARSTGLDLARLLV